MTAATRTRRPSTKVVVDQLGVVPPKAPRTRKAKAVFSAPAVEAHFHDDDTTPTVKLCECGCGTQVTRRFARGHASTMRAAARKAELAAVKHCECGCGVEVTRRFARGHDAKVRSAEIAALKAAMPTRTCECGCGSTVTRRFVKGHASTARANAFAKLQVENNRLRARIAKLTAK